MPEFSALAASPTIGEPEPHAVFRRAHPMWRRAQKKLGPVAAANPANRCLARSPQSTFPSGIRSREQGSFSVLTFTALTGQRQLLAFADDLDKLVLRCQANGLGGERETSGLR